MKTFGKITMIHMVVTDMEKSKLFYVDMLGFKITKDYGHDENHWVSLDAPRGGTSLNLTKKHENMKPGTMKLYLSTPNIEAAYEELKEKGVKPTSEIAGDGWGKWFSITDPDDNHWLIVQS